MLNTSNGAHKLLSNFDVIAQAPQGVAKLRELILTLAVQGKLVPQDANDEPASVLLERIRAKKAGLVAAGQIKKDKPLDSVSEGDKPFEIPVGWEWVRLGEVVEIIRGITFPANEKTKEAASGRIACLRTANIQDQIEWDDLLFVAESFVGREDQKLQLHDIVMSMANSRELVGKVALVNHIPHSQVSFGGFLGVLRPWELDARFVMGLLRTAYARSTLIDSASQTTNIANISLGKLRPLVFPLPPLAEQSRIVARVESLMQLCDALEAQGQLEATQHQQLLQSLLGSLTQSADAAELAHNWQRMAAHFDVLLDRPEAIDALEQTILQFAVRGLLVPQDPADEPASELLKKIRTEKDRLIAEGKIKRDKPLPAIGDEEKPFELPVGWEWARLGSLLQKIGAGSTPRGGREVYVKSGVKFLRSQNVWDDGLRLNGVAFIKSETHEKMAGTLVVANDLLFNITGASIGRCAVVPGDFDEANVSQHVTIIRSVLPDINTFLHKVLISRYVQQAVMDVQVGVSREGLSIAKLSQFLIPVPPPIEQSRIVTRVNDLRALCQQLREQLTRVRHTQGLLAQAWVEQAVA